MRTKVQAVAFLGFLLLGFQVTAADARSIAYEFDIPSQDLNAALQQLAIASQHKLFYQSKLVDGKTSPALKGEFTTDQALEALLNSTNLTYDITPSAIVLIRDKQSPPEPSPAVAVSSGVGIRLADAGQAPAPLKADSAASSQPDTENVVSEVVVTGSRLAGAPVGANVVTVSRADLVKTGVQTTDQLVALIPALSGIGLSEASKATQGGNANWTNASGANLRGLGATATLTLVDGHRTVLNGVTARSADLSSVPTLALERVEVLTDGASAIYGSDAVAGVVNLILRRNVQGIEFSGGIGGADDYDTHRYGVAFGHGWDSGQASVIAEHTYHSSLSGADRTFNRMDLSSFGGVNGAIINCAPGTATVRGTTYAILSGGGFGAAGSRNSCEPFNNNDLLPEHERTGVVATANQDFGDSLKFLGDAMYVKRETLTHYAFSSNTLNLSQANPYFQLPAGVALTDLPFCAGSTTLRCLPVSFDPGGFLGKVRSYESSTEQYTAHGKLSYALGSNWTLSGEYVYGHDISEFTGHTLATPALNTAAASSNPATAIDPFQGRTSAATLAALADYISFSNVVNTMSVYSAGIDGTLLTLPGGDVRATVGYEHRNNGFFLKYLLGPSNAARARRSYKRDIDAFSGEVVVPIVSSANARPGLEGLSLSLAVRREDYSDFGATTDPKVGINYEPYRGLKLRGTYTTSFRAPIATELVSSTGGTSSYLTTADPLAGGANVSTLQINDGNPDLGAETAKQFSLGIDLMPELLGGLRASATYFNIDYEGVVTSQYNNPDILNQESIYSSLITRNPTAEQIAAVTSRYLLVNNPSGAVAAIIDGRPNNLGAIKLSGIDFEFSHASRHAFGSLGLSLLGTYLFNFDVAASQTAPFVEQVDHYGYPVRFRTRAGASWQAVARLEGFSASAYINFTDSYRDRQFKVDSYTTVDANLGYELAANSPLGGLRLGLTVGNLFDQDPPFVNRPAYLFNPGGYDPQQASALGRTVEINLTKRF